MTTEHKHSHGAGSCCSGLHAHDHSPAAHKPTANPAGAGSEAIYSCPMHPEIRQVAPGSCPICGMALEPVMPTAEEDDSEMHLFMHRTHDGHGWSWNEETA